MVNQCLKIKTGYFILHFHSFYQISDTYIAEWLIFELKAGVNSKKGTERIKMILSVPF